MAVLTFSEEMDRARMLAAFSNGFEGDAWMGHWCETCVLFDGCVLVDVALLGRTPQAWQEDQPFGLASRYVCAEYTREATDG